MRPRFEFVSGFFAFILVIEYGYHDERVGSETLELCGLHALVG